MIPGLGSYDGWKLRSDLDDNPREQGPRGRDWSSPALQRVIERAREVCARPVKTSAQTNPEGRTNDGNAR